MEFKHSLQRIVLPVLLGLAATVSGCSDDNCSRNKFNNNDDKDIDKGKGTLTVYHLEGYKTHDIEFEALDGTIYFFHNHSGDIRLSSEGDFATITTKGPSANTDTMRVYGHINMPDYLNDMNVRLFFDGHK